MNYDDAKSYCVGIGAALPEKQDFIRLREYMGAEKDTPDYTVPEGYTAQVLPNLDDFFWSSSVHPDDSDSAFFFDGRYGDIYYDYRSYDDFSVRCGAQRR